MSVFEDFEKCVMRFKGHSGQAEALVKMPVPFAYFHILKLLLIVSLAFTSYAIAPSRRHVAVRLLLFSSPHPPTPTHHLPRAVCTPCASRHVRPRRVRVRRTTDQPRCLYPVRSSSRFKLRPPPLIAPRFVSRSLITIIIGLQSIAIAMSDPFGRDDLDFDLQRFLMAAYDNAVAMLTDQRTALHDRLPLDCAENPLADSERARRLRDPNVFFSMPPYHAAPPGANPPRDGGSIRLPAPSTRASDPVASTEGTGHGSGPTTPSKSPDLKGTPALSLPPPRTNATPNGSPANANGYARLPSSSTRDADTGGGGGGKRRVVRHATMQPGTSPPFLHPSVVPMNMEA